MGSPHGMSSSYTLVVRPRLRSAWTAGEVDHLRDSGQSGYRHDACDREDVVAPTPLALVGVHRLSRPVPPEPLPRLTCLSVGVPARCHVDPRCSARFVPVDSLQHPTGAAERSPYRRGPGRGPSVRCAPWSMPSPDCRPGRLRSPYACVPDRSTRWPVNGISSHRDHRWSASPRPIQRRGRPAEARPP